jgi:transcription termination factor Rho
LDPDDLNRIWVLRKVLQPLNTIDAMEFLFEKIKDTKNNVEFMASMSK